MPTGESVEAVREKAEILDGEGLRRAITRIAHEIIEKNGGTDGLVLAGIRRRGYPLAQRIAARIMDGAVAALPLQQSGARAAGHYCDARLKDHDAR